jgi:hypothetical protein
MGALAGRFAATFARDMEVGGREAVGRGLCTKSLQNFGIVVEAV